MRVRSPRVHCELGPVLVNRTAVYQMCKAAPRELAARGFQVNSSALLARLDSAAEPVGPRERALFERSERWLRGAGANPAWFLKSRHLPGLRARWRHARGVSLFMDPLYPLFFTNLDRGVVVAHDTTPVTDPDWHPPGVGRLYEVAFDRIARGRFHIVAPSRNTADHLRVNWGVAPSRLTVLHEGVFSFPEPEVPAGKYAEAPFLLFVGALDPRKNVEGLIRAYAAAGLYAGHGLRLRLIGFPQADDHPVRVLARSTPGVDVAGFTSAGEVAAAYRDCFAFVYPSLCEGFGLPLLEAMHHGCLCLSTICGASPEVSGGAALYADPYDHDELTRGLRRLVEMPDNERQRLRHKARDRAATFTWDRFFDGLADVLRREAGVEDVVSKKSGWPTAAPQKESPARVVPEALPETARERTVAPLRAGLAAYLQSVWNCRYFWMSLVVNDLRARYRGSALGMGWSLLNPVLMTAILCFAFSTIFHQDPRQFAPFLFAGLTIWNFVLGVAQQGCTCFMQAEGYIRQHPAPMAIYPLRTVLSVAFHLVIGLVPVILLAGLLGKPTEGASAEVSAGGGFIGPAAFLCLIPGLVLLLVMGWALAVIVGLLNVWFRDTRHLIDIVMQVIFYLTPIIYPPELLLGHWFSLVLRFNPLMPFLRLIRDPILLNQVPSLKQYAAATLIVVLSTTLAATALSKTERQLIFHL
jgi:lipopolysaccharide transport system permease protein